MEPELRAPTMGDLPELVAFFVDLHERFGGHALTEGQLRDNLTNETWKPKENLRVALVDGRIAGWGGLWSPMTETGRAYLAIRGAQELEVYRRLLDWGERRTVEAAGGPVRVRVSAEQQDGVLGGELRRRGYELVRHFFEMQIDLDGEPAEPVWPEGLTVRTFTLEDARAVYEADLEAFEGHWDSFDVSFDEWHEYFIGSSEFDAELWWLAEDGAELAGFAMCSNKGGRGAGVVNVLGVRPPWRRRGLGTALLLHAFREFRARGRAQVRLNVDGENTTGAVRLYERAGMHVIRQSDQFMKDLA
jgi:ribosomal protein S18 acetylase RimI-like enzyme